MSGAFWTRLWRWAKSATGFVLNAARQYGPGILERLGLSPFAIRPWMMAIPAFLLIVWVLPDKLLAIPGYFIVWVVCLGVSWWTLEE